MTTTLPRRHLIYRITNLLDGKVYIGQTLNPTARWRTHKNSSSKQKISKAIRELGHKSFIFEIISTTIIPCICSKTKEVCQLEADYLEKELINQYNSFSDSGYNRTFGGGGNGSGLNRINWPEDQELLRLANEHGITKLAKIIGAAVSSTSQRLIERGLKFTPQPYTNYVNKGENNHLSRLNEQQVLEIAKLYKTGTFFLKDLADQFKVSGSCIESIITGKSWKHITGINFKPSDRYIDWPNDEKLVKIVNEIGIAETARLLDTGKSAVSYRLKIKKLKYNSPNINPGAFKKGLIPHNTKINEQIVSQIVELYNTGKYTQKELSNKFSLGKTTITSILNGSRWSSLTGITYTPKKK